ncbi:hypothetical protein GCM10009630_16490 [Kribbella jejuensis]|uniref:Uncharacterized protein n=1 Tax=Kribbella jejuensis TaxID=236068 RepID=A0A542EBA4_9ACTN|nr:hypothetical protein [Kribbella jejuensis]TQJ12581.1 hypothetical protein FB475_5529 [Kribbella jejuensis]
MANEAEYAGWTNRVAQAMFDTQRSLDSLSGHLGNDLGRALDRRRDELDMLRPGIRSLAAAEHDYDQAQGAAKDPARERIYSTYRSYQSDAGLLSNQLGGIKAELAGHNEALAQRAESLKDAMRDLDRIKELPGRDTPELAKLREGVEYFRAVVNSVGPRVQAMVNEMQTAQQAARAFADGAASVGTQAHSANIGRVVGQLEDSLAQTEARGGALRKDLTDNRASFGLVTDYGVGIANRATDERNLADKQAAQLADSMRAGVNPTRPADQRPVANLAESDLSRRLDGPAQETGRTV